MSAVADAVVDYVDHAGWALLLVGPVHKRPHWRTPSVHDATRDAGLLQGWLRESPDAGVAVNLGMSGLASVEDDGPEGLRALERLEARHGPLPPTWEFRARRGRHRLYLARDVAGRRLGPDLELKARGQAATLPPSTIEGVRRRWVPGTVRRPLACLPEWLARTPVPSPVVPAEIVSSDAAAQFAVLEVRTRLSLRPASRGTGRGTALFAAACELGRHVHAGTLAHDVAVSVLQDAGRRLRLAPYERERAIQRGLAIGPERNI